MSILNDRNLLFSVSKEYYIETLSQNEIAVKNHISRSQVSKILANARKEGIVKIEVVSPDELQLTARSRRLAELLHLKNVFIISHSDESLFFHAVANCINDYIINFKHIGLGWGPVMYKVAKSLSYSNPNQIKKSICSACV